MKRGGGKPAVRGDCDQTHCSGPRPDNNPMATLCQFHLTNGNDAVSPSQEAYFKSVYTNQGQK